MKETTAIVAFWAIVGFTALLLSLRAGDVPLFDPDEARFARTSVEMMRSRDLVVPTFGHEPRLVKPPLLHWIQSALFSTFGAGERMARLPALAATLGTLLLVGGIARRRFGWEGAVWAAAVTITMPLVLVIGQIGTLDALLALHVLAALALDIAEPKEIGRYRGVAIGALLGLGFLIKGPVGVLLPVVMMLAGRTATGRRILPDGTTFLRAAAAWCLVVLPWGIAFLARIGAEEVGTVMRGEVLARYFEGTDHVEPSWYYLAVITVGFFPWIGPLVLALVRMLVQRNDPVTRTALFAGSAFVAGLLFLSIGRGKLPNYALPLAPLAALLVTWELGQELNNPRERVAGTALLSASLGAAAVGLGLATGLGLQPAAAGVAAAGATVFGVAAVAALAGVIARRPRWVYGSAAAASALFLTVAVLFLMPEISTRRTSAHLVVALPELHDPERSVVVVDMKVPSLLYYLDSVPEEVPISRLADRIAQSDDPLFVFDEVDLHDVPPASVDALVPVGAQGKYRVFEKRQRRLTAEPPRG